VETGGENEAMEHIAQDYYRAIAQGKTASPTSLTAEQLTEMADEYWQRNPIMAQLSPIKCPIISAILA
jgi:hypothetical protein